jgi:hypothetical protein
MKLEASLAQLKAELIRAELAVERDGVPEDGAVAEARLASTKVQILTQLLVQKHEYTDARLSCRGLSAARRMSILAHMEAIEKELELSDTASLVEQVLRSSFRPHTLVASGRIH